MPEIVEDYEFGPPAASYPWEEWLQDGVTRVYVRGVDFQTTTRAFASTIRKAAWRLGWQLQIDRGPETVAARPYPRDDEGWKKEQQRRAEQLQDAAQMIHDAD